jgi:hypothetical protein
LSNLQQRSSQFNLGIFNTLTRFQDYTLHVVILILRNDSELWVLVDKSFNLDGNLEVVFDYQRCLQNCILDIRTVIDLSLGWRHFLTCT